MLAGLVARVLGIVLQRHVAVEVFHLVVLWFNECDAVRVGAGTLGGGSGQFQHHRCLQEERDQEDAQGLGNLRE